MDRSKIMMYIIGTVITTVTVMLLGHFIAPDSSLILLGLVGAVLGLFGSYVITRQIEKIHERVEYQLDILNKEEQLYDPKTKEFFLTDVNDAFIRDHAQEITKTAKIDRNVNPSRIAVTHAGKVFGYIDDKYNATLIPVLDQFAGDFTIRVRLYPLTKVRLGVSIRSKKTAAREALKKAFDACAEL